MNTMPDQADTGNTQAAFADERGRPVSGVKMVPNKQSERLQLRQFFARAGSLVAVCLVLSTCSVTGARPAPDTAVLENMRDVLDEADRSHSVAAYEPPAQQGVADLTPGLSIDDELLIPVENRFNIAANQESARTFFSNLVAGTDFGVLVSPSVEGEISINLPNVTIDEVMQAIEKTYGYTITRNGNIYQVQAPTMQSRIFTIDYLNVRRAGSSNVSVSSGNSGGSRSGSGGLNGGSNGVGAVGGSGVVSAGTNNGVGGVSGGRSGGGGGGQVSTETETDFWTDITETLESLIGGTAEGRSVITQPQVGLIMITAMPAELDRAGAYLAQAQGILSREVTIQVQFLEVILNKGFQSAMDFDTFGPGGPENSDNDVAASFGAGTNAGNIDGISNPLAIVTNFTDFRAVFRLLESRGTTQVLSSPSLKVLNNQKAVFQDGDEEYFQTSAGSNVISTGDTIAQSTANNLQPFFSGISMDITPQISIDGSITLHVHPTITTVTEQTKPIAGQQVPLARTSVRELDSVIRAEDGKIVVLGGLAYERAIDDAAGIPGAANLPAIGAAFDQRRRTTVKSEFIILLRPVIGSDQSEQQLIRARSDRLSEINRDLDPFSSR